MSGGSFRVTEEEILLGELIDEVRDEEVGAMVAFLGTVRRHFREREVQHQMAEKKLTEIGQEMEERWGKPAWPSLWLPLIEEKRSRRQGTPSIG